MSYDLERQTLEQHFSANWATTPIAWQNVDYKPIAGTAFVRFSVLPVQAEPRSVNSVNGLFRHFGTIIISVFTPANQGTKASLQYCDTICGFMRAKSLSNGVRTLTPFTQQVGAEGGFYQINISVPYYRDTIF